MERYIFLGGEVGQLFAEAFAEKVRQGIPVKILVDADRLRENHRGRWVPAGLVSPDPLVKVGTGETAHPSEVIDCGAR